MTALASPFTDAAIIAFVTPRIEANEGFRSAAYKDTLGNWTIGFGRQDSGVVFGMTCTRAEAEAWLSGKLKADCVALDQALPWWRSLDMTRASVLLEMAYNMGLGWPTGTHGPQDKGRGLLSFQRMLGQVEAGNYGQAGALMLLSHWAKPADEGGVGDRAMRLAILMEHGGSQS